jgi:hypothetical protein
LLSLFQNPDPHRPAKSIAGREQTNPAIGPKEAVQCKINLFQPGSTGLGGVARRLQRRERMRIRISKNAAGFGKAKPFAISGRPIPQYSTLNFISVQIKRGAPFEKSGCSLRETVIE